MTSSRAAGCQTQGGLVDALDQKMPHVPTGALQGDLARAVGVRLWVEYRGSIQGARR